MYTVSEAADILSVDNTRVYEQLLANSDLFRDTTTRRTGVLYVSEEALLSLGKLLGVNAKDFKKPGKPRRLMTDSERELQKMSRQVEILLKELSALDREILEKDRQILAAASALAGLE